MVEAPELAPPIERVTPIPPSEALALGRLRAPRQIYGQMYDHQGGACAVGAMILGYGLPGGRFPEALAIPVRPPCGCPSFSNGLPVYGAVMDLNDTHHWSDAQIVAWLQEIGQ